MTSIANGSVIIQSTSESVPSTPSWFGEVALMAAYLRKHGILTKISERVRFARRRFGQYEVIDFVVVLFGYAISGERTLEMFYERLQPFAVPFMALFGRDRLPVRSTLSRFLAALTTEPIEALRTLFLEDLRERRADFEQHPCGLTDRAGKLWKIFDIDGTREASRKRALPKRGDQPVAQRRLDEVCAPGYTGRKRGEVVRTRTTVLQAHSYQWLGTFGNPGNGEYRKELRRAVEAIQSYLRAHQLPDASALLRLDGLYGTGAVLADLLGLPFVMRCKLYELLELPIVQTRLHLPADQQFTLPESSLVRTLYDCPDVPVGAGGQQYRLVVATHPKGPKKQRIGIERDGLIYELFLTTLPQEACTASDVVALYLHRGSFETTLSDEDAEQDPDRWCSHAACGQEAWQIISQWLWNLRLELGHLLEPEPLRTTVFAPALAPVKAPAAPASGYAPAEVALPFKQGRFSGHDFVLQPDGTLRCPAGQTLSATEERREGDGSLRLVYAARMSHCRGCQLREQCQWHGRTTTKSRRVSVLLHPLHIGSAPLLWMDWSRRQHRRACMQLLRHQRVDVHLEPPDQSCPVTSPPILSRAQRAHYRLSWEQRLARNACASTTSQSTITLFGVPGYRRNDKKIRQCLRDFNFKALFVEELGWDILGERPLMIPVDGTTYVLRPLVEKRGVRVFVCEADAQGRIPADGVLRKIEREVIRHAYEHFIISVDAARKHQVWLWVKREQGKRLASRIHRYHQGQSGELLAQKLERLAIGLEEEERLQMVEVAGRVAKAFDVERVTKKFYDRFKREHAAFLALIQGIEAQADREWYASLMLNRLMFLYFIQRKGFLDTQTSGKLDGDPNYLSNRLKRVQQERGENQFHTFYRYFLLKLFHEGLSQRVHAPELEALLGKVPYLNGGLFDVHVLEQANPEITIPDEVFEQLFAFLDEFDWYLDDRPLRSDREINPDVLGYIFEKYINQKQMGAYYTKEDITEYISKSTILPFLLDATERKCQIAFRPDGPVWSLLRENPDAYIYDAIKKGCDVPLPQETEAGIHDVAQRGEWNRPAPEAYALPTETWREVVSRRIRYQEVRAKLGAGEITSANDLITFNLDSRRFVEDVITYCTGTDLLWALYDSIEHVTVLDPTCGSGAFLFSALGILEGLYEACLERMQDLVEEREILDAATPQERRHRSPDTAHFRTILERVKQHPSRAYFIYKSIIIRNLYGVDIMEEATEICKLRLFLKLVSQVERFDDIEPLPDIDFNIRAGNTLVGFASQEETKQAIAGKAVGKGGTRDEKAFQNQMIFDDRLDRIEQKAQDIERAFEQFRELQTKQAVDPADMAAKKQQLQQMLVVLRAELDSYQASEYGIDRNNIPKKEEYEAKFAQWQQSHQPFHCWVEFYGIIKKGGFDAIIGNPPWVEYRTISDQYTVRNLSTRTCNNLWAFVVERSLRLLSLSARCGLIVPMSLVCSERMVPVHETLRLRGTSWLSNYESDTHPGQLFDGVEQNVSILLHLTGTAPKQYTTRLYRFFSDARDLVFWTVQYTELVHTHMRFGFAKISEKIEAAILEKLFAHPKLGNLLVKKGERTVYVHRIAHYYIKCFNFIPYFKSQRDGVKKSEDYKEYSFLPPVEPFVSVINSSIFYFYWQVFFDSFKAGKQCVEEFPCAQIIDSPSIHKLTTYCTELMADIKRNARRLHVRYAATGNVEYDQFDPRRSKPIIDKR